MTRNNLNKLLGEKLVRQGLITEEQLWKAIRLQSESDATLGQVLIKLGYITEDILSAAGDAPVYSIANYDPEALNLVPEHFIRNFKVIPLHKEGDTLVVATVRPVNVVALDDLRLLTGLHIEPVTVEKSEIDAFIQKQYGFPEIAKALAGSDETSLDISAAEESMDLEDDSLANEAPIIRLVNSLFIQAIEENASDMHIEPYAGGVRIRFRIDGFLKEVMQLPRHIKAAVTSRIKIISGMDIAEKRLPQDGRINIKFSRKNIDLRVSTLPTIYGEKVVVRILDKTRVSDFALEQIGFSPANLVKFQQALRSNFGLVLLTGPTGSGKTTTLYAALNYLNDTEKNIVTEEDPVEYMLDGISQTQVNIKTGLTFAVGLRAILRQDPDIIMVGEIRDRETAAIAVRAAITGHLVLSTLHTNDAPGAITRLIDMGIEPFLVASSVLCVVGQRLVRLLCPHCRETLPLAPGAPERVFINAGPEEKIETQQGRGCDKCGQTGYRGRLPIQDLLVMTPGLRSLITGNVPTGILRQKALEDGMITMKQDGLAKAALGLTSIQEVMRVAHSPDE
ncbi:MAG: GspE/PulE family protein [Firmicutes bacterium]|nr:GspE/PulE family protein [Bacillota bacterium]